MSDKKRVKNALQLLQSKGSVSKKKKPKTTTMTETLDSERYFQHDKWWIDVPVPEVRRCTVKSCPFEPVHHPMHKKPRKFMSFIEKKILLKYLIKNDRIKEARGLTVYKMMIDRGYLKHRTVETLRNNFRRTIVHELDSYKLDPKHMAQFKEVAMEETRKK